MEATVVTITASTRTTGVQIQDISEVPLSDYPPQPDSVSFMDFYFMDPGRRTLRVKSFYRLNPGEVHDRTTKKHPTPEGAPRYENRHRHVLEKIVCDLHFPLPDSGLDPIEPIGGWVRYHPEGVWYGPFDASQKRVGPDDRVIVHCHIHTEGSLYQPLQTWQSTADNLAKIERERPGSILGPDAYVAFDGELVDRPLAHQDAGYEEWQGKRMTWNEPAVSDDLIRLNVNGFPWYDHSRGALIKPIAAFNAMGPISWLMRLEPGATLPEKAISDHRMMSVMAGNVTLGDDRLKDLTIAFGSPGDNFPSVTANEPSILFFARWYWKDGPIAPFWYE
jgi:hypothetical protein